MLDEIVREIIGDRVDAQVAKAMGLHRSAVCGWKKGKRMELGSLKRLLDACEADEDLRKRALDCWVATDGEKVGAA